MIDKIGDAIKNRFFNDLPLLTMKKIDLLPNLITAVGLSCGLFVIFKMATLPADASILKAFQQCTLLLLLAGLADLLDGAVARALKAESDFGMQFDSLADAISFGAAPAVMMAKSLAMFSSEKELHFMITAAAITYALGGILRLARFNTAASQVKSGEDPLEIIAHKKNFTGLPIPAAALAITSIHFLILQNLNHPTVLSWGTYFRPFAMVGILFFVSFLMVSRWKFPSLKMLNFRVGSFYLMCLSILLSAILFYGFLHYLALTLSILIWTYILISLFLSLMRIATGNRMQTLKDFEPDDED